MSEEQLRDSILRGALLLQLLVNAKSGEVDAALLKLVADLKTLLNTRILSEATKADINALIKQGEQAIQPAYGEIAGAVDTEALALVVADKTVAALNDNLPIEANAPTAARIASLTKDVLIDGAPSSAWWAKQADDTAFKFAAAVRQGVINGETNEQIVARVTSKGGDGVIDIARRNARTLVHSSVMSAANDARLATFRANSRFIAGVRELATLDSHTCVVCAARDGAAWDLDGNPLYGTKAQFLSMPIHWSCRCVLSPIPKLKFSGGDRASSSGQVASTTTFEDFLKRQTPEFVDRVLGKRRAELFLEGRLTLSDLITGSGRELTLEELGIH